MKLILLYKTFLLFHLTVTVSCTYSKSRAYVDKETGGYNDIMIVISPELKASDCPRILEDIKAAFTEASESLFKALEGQIYFSSIDILVPQNWTALDCQTPLNLHRASGRQAADFYIGHDHPIYKRAPWTQQSLGCGQPGDFIYIPASFIWSSHHQARKSIQEEGTNATTEETTRNLQCGDEIRDRWLQYRFGVFSTELDRVPSPGSPQDAFCLGKSPNEIVQMHPDLKFATKNVGGGSAENDPKIVPKFIVSRQEPPRYVVILENSSAMNRDNVWDLLRTATKKFIVHDLPSEAQLGLVLFNDGAHIAHTVGELTDSIPKRNGIAVQIENKFHLNPKTDSCVRCGVLKAIEALQTSGSTVGATFILISQGKSTSLSSGFEKDLTDLSRRHRLRIFSIAVPSYPYTDISLSLERLSHNTGGLSFFISEKTHLDTYVGLLEAFREIQLRTQNVGPYLVHENRFNSFGPSEETGSFVIDKYIGQRTSFSCFALYPGNTENGYVKSITLEDRKGNRFKSIVDSMAFYHILSLYNVPFESEQNVGMNWTYTLERLAAPLDDVGGNAHVVQVVSRPRHPDEFINLHFFTNLLAYSTEVTLKRPVKFFAEVKLNEVPVLDARVRVKVDVVNLSGQKTDGVWVELLDNGNGDPDVTINDGVYSRYLADFDLGEGRYEVTVFVDDNAGRAFSFQKERSYGSRSCCKNVDLEEFDTIINQKLGSFQRILRGESFRIHSIQIPEGSIPPARILDMAINVHRETHELEFTWTAPGDNYDHGQVSSYRLYNSPSVGEFYTNLNSTNFIDNIAATKAAGRRESYRIKAVDFNKNLFYTIVPVDKSGNVAAVSNVQGAFMPAPEVPKAKNVDIAALTEVDGVDVVVANPKKPDKIVVILAVGVLSFLFVCIVSVILIVVLSRRKKAGRDNLSSEENSIYGDNDDKIYGIQNFYEAKASIYDEQEILKEFEKRQFLTSSNLTDSNSQFTERNFINNNLSNNNATWQKNLSQPRQQPQLQTQQSYSQQDQPLPQPPALYAVPIPRSQRSRLNDLYTSSPRTPTSSVNSGHSQTRQQMPEPIYSNEAIQNLVDTLTEEFANENVQSYLEGTTTFVDQYYSNLYNITGDERLSQTSSSHSTADGQPQHQQQHQTPTIKSILKKRDNVSNEDLDGFGSGSIAAGIASVSSAGSSQTSQELRVVDDEEKFRESEERLLSDLSPTRVFLETSFEATRPPVIQEVTEDENDESANDGDDANNTFDDLPPPPPPISDALESFLTPVKNADVSLNASRGGFSDRKVRNVTQV